MVRRHLGQRHGELGRWPSPTARRRDIDLNTATDADRTAIATWLADPAVARSATTSKDPMALKARGWIWGLTMDTALAAYLALPGNAVLISAICAHGSWVEICPPASGDAQLALDESTDAAAGGTAARATRDLAEVLTDQLQERTALDLLRQVEQPLQRVLADMEATGIRVDLPHLEQLESGFADQVRAAESEAHSLAGRPFNLGSPKQLQEVLFVERGLPKTKRIKTGYTTDADALQTLFAKTGGPLLATLLRWRDVSRLRQTVAGLIPLADDSHRIHPPSIRRWRPRADCPARTRTCRTSPCAPTRTAHPGGLRRRTRIRLPAHRRLLTDRDADHGAPPAMKA